MTVTDDDTGTVTTTKAVTVHNVAPTATLGVQPATVAEGADDPRWSPSSMPAPPTPTPCAGELGRRLARSPRRLRRRLAGPLVNLTHTFVDDNPTDHAGGRAHRDR